MLNLLSPSAQAALVALIDERVAEQLATASDSDPRRPWLTVDEAAEYLRTTPAAIRKRISRKQLRAHRPEGSRIMFRRDELDEALDPGSIGPMIGPPTTEWASGAPTPWPRHQEVSPDARS